MDKNKSLVQLVVFVGVTVHDTRFELLEESRLLQCVPADVKDMKLTLEKGKTVESKELRGAE